MRPWVGHAILAGTGGPRAATGTPSAVRSRCADTPGVLNGSGERRLLWASAGAAPHQSASRLATGGRARAPSLRQSTCADRGLDTMERMAAHALSARCGDILRRIDDAMLGLPVEAATVEDVMRDLLGDPPDLVAASSAPGCRLMFLQTIVNLSRVEQALIQPLIQSANGVTFTARPKQVRTNGDGVQALLNAEVLLVRDGQVAAVAMDQWPKRDPTEPPAEIVAQGPHVGFVEDLQTNIALLRQRIRDPRLRWEHVSVGARSHAPGALLHIEGLARADVLANVRGHLHEAAAALSFAEDTSMLQEWLTRVSGWLFPTMESTERPDVAAAALLEGRLLVLLDGSPVAVIAPVVFAYLVQTPMDYYNRAFDAWLKRVIRLGSLLTSLLISPTFVAVLSLNQELLPGRLFVSIAQSRLGVPLPVVFEVLLMEVIIEMVREAGMRMPGSVGQTVSIVGAIVIGQSAVMAGLISASVVVVVALAYIASTVIPSLDARVALRLLRFPLILLAAWLGLFGLIWGMLVLFLYLLALESFGTPYLAPLAPRRARGLHDTIRRLPLTDMRRSFMARRRGMPR